MHDAATGVLRVEMALPKSPGRNAIGAQITANIAIPEKLKMTGNDILDARTFQQQLRALANTLALKVEREGPKLPL